MEKTAGRGKFLRKETYYIFFLLSGVYAFGISAIIRANFWYKDDIGRTVEGYLAWGKSSRFISDLMAILINANISLSDISPLPQLIAVMFMAAAAMILLDTFSFHGKWVTAAKLIAVIPLAINPYFIENFSFKFDAPFMALSVLSAVLPLLMIEKSKVWYALSVVFSTLLTLTTYQASTGIFPAVVVIYSFCLWNSHTASDKKIARFILLSAAGYAAALVIFKLFIMHNSAGYNNGAMFPLRQFLPGVLGNYRKYISRLRALPRFWKILIVLNLAGFFAAEVRYSKRPKMFSALLAAMAMALSGIFSFGILVALQNLKTPCRSSYGIFVVLTLTLICIADQPVFYAGKAVGMILVWCFFTFSFTYGNALCEYNRYMEMRLQQVVSELNRLPVMETEQDKILQMKGDMGESSTISRLRKVYPILGMLLPSKSGGVYVESIQNIKYVQFAAYSEWIWSAKAK